MSIITSLGCLNFTNSLTHNLFSSSINERGTSPKPNEVLRPIYRPRAGLAESAFQPLDKIFIRVSEVTGQKEGPYLIEKDEGGRYSLCDEDGGTVKDGRVYDASELISYAEGK